MKTTEITIFVQSEDEVKQPAAKVRKWLFEQSDTGKLPKGMIFTGMRVVEVEPPPTKCRSRTSKSCSVTSS